MLSSSCCTLNLRHRLQNSNYVSKISAQLHQDIVPVLESDREKFIRQLQCTVQRQVTREGFTPTLLVILRMVVNGQTSHELLLPSRYLE